MQGKKKVQYKNATTNQLTASNDNNGGQARRLVVGVSDNNNYELWMSYDNGMRTNAKADG